LDGVACEVAINMVRIKYVAIARAPVVSVNPWFRCFPLFSRSSAAA